MRRARKRAEGAKVVKPTYPVVGQVFELTLDGDAPENQPLAMVRRIGYSTWEKWLYKGPTVKGIQTGVFKLVEFDRFLKFDDLHRILDTHGRIPEGQWAQAFKTAYPKYDGVCSIGFPDKSWVDDIGWNRHPLMYYTDYILNLGLAHRDGRIDLWHPWLWLVEVR